MLVEKGTMTTFGRWFALRTIVLDSARLLYVTVFRAGSPLQYADIVDYIFDASLMIA